MVAVGILLLSLLYIIGGLMVGAMLQEDNEEPSLAIIIFWPLLFVAVIFLAIAFLINELVKKITNDKSEK